MNAEHALLSKPLPNSSGITRAICQVQHSSSRGVGLSCIRQAWVCIGLASGTMLPKVSRGDPDQALEGFREMALVGEASGQSDLKQRCIRMSKLMARVVDAQPAQVVAQRAVVVLSES